MTSLPKVRGEWIIILIFLLLLSAVWIWYGIRLKEIERQKGGLKGLTQGMNVQITNQKIPKTAAL